jgi:uncharacterized protein (TIGR02266 family)
MEKRQTHRLPLAMEVTYESGDEFMSSFLSDIGGGGVFIGTHDPLEPGTTLRLCFHIPGFTDSLMVSGTVVWVRGLETGYKPGMGVRFDEMEPEDRERLDRYLAAAKEK